MFGTITLRSLWDREVKTGDKEDEAAEVLVSAAEVLIPHLGRCRPDGGNRAESHKQFARPRATRSSTKKMD